MDECPTLIMARNALQVGPADDWESVRARVSEIARSYAVRVRTTRNGKSMAEVRARLTEYARMASQLANMMDMDRASLVSEILTAGRVKLGDRYQNLPRQLNELYGELEQVAGSIALRFKPNDPNTLSSVIFGSPAKFVAVEGFRLFAQCRGITSIPHGGRGYDNLAMAIVDLAAMDDPQIDGRGVEHWSRVVRRHIRRHMKNRKVGLPVFL